MAKGRPGKAVANERSHPFIIEVPVAANGLDRALSREIVAFHKSQYVKPRFGRTIFRDGQSYFRWCFSDLDIARAFLESLVERSTADRRQHRQAARTGAPPLIIKSAPGVALAPR
jgi:hypothetical protein